MEIPYDPDREEVVKFQQLMPITPGEGGKSSIMSYENTMRTVTESLNCGNKNLSRRGANDQFLKKLVRKRKVQRLVNNFCAKISRNNANSSPVEFKVTAKQGLSTLQKFLISTHGVQLSPIQLTITTLISITLIVLLSVSYSLALVFPEIKEYSFINNVQFLGLIYFAFEIVFNFFKKSYDEGKYIESLSDIAMNYLKGRFFIDALSYVVLLIDSASFFDSAWLTYCRLIILAKLSQNLQRIEAIENLLITNYSREQYWGLVCVLLANFSFAHIVALLLNSMSQLDQVNWITAHGFTESPWYQRYVWGYYWATTTMLTVGFGDFAATNYKEAICLIFVEMISCISLAYNINCVGNLISNLRSQSIERNKNQKIFNIMAKSSRVSYDLETRINHYIQGSFLIKKEFNFNEQDSLLQFLPTNLKKEYLREANKPIFQRLSIFKDFTDKTRSKLAESMVRIITHPEEIIQKKGEMIKFMVLQTGEISYCLKKKGSTIDGKCVHTIKIIPHKHPARLLSLDFLKGKHLLYNIKSISYCVIFFFENEDLLNTIKQNNYDFEHFCMIRDRQAYIINDLQLEKCQYCPRQYHSVFVCPRLHYCPLRQQIVNRQLYRTRHVLFQRRVHKPRKRYHKFFNINMVKKDMQSFNEQTSYNNQTASFQITDFLAGGWGDKPSSFKQLDKLKTLLCQQGSVNTVTQLNPISSYDMNVIYELIKGHMPTEDSFWTLQADQMYNWKYYFPSYNPQNIQSRFRRKRR